MPLQDNASPYNLYIMCCAYRATYLFCMGTTYYPAHLAIGDITDSIVHLPVPLILP